MLCESFACLRVELLELADKLAVGAEQTWPLVVKKTLLSRFTLDPYWLPERLALVVLVR